MVNEIRSSIDRVMTRSARFLAIGGVASIVFGVTVLLWPGISLAALTALFGAFAFVYGSFSLGVGLTLLARRSTEWVPFTLGGIAGVVIAAITFLHPAATDLALTFLIGAWAFVVGVLEIAGAIDMWGEIDGALWLAINGAASVIFGILVAFRPGAGLLAILWLIGIYAVFAGVIRLVAAWRMHQFHSEVKTTVGAMRTSSQT